MIVVKTLSKRYGSGPYILKSLSMSIDAGQTTAILGKSGVGKSTLLRCLAGIERFDDGTVEVDGVVVGARQSADALRGRVGVVFQGLELFPHLTVLDNCTLAPRLVRKDDAAVANDNANELLEALDVGGVGDAYPAALSGGQRQRVAIVRALMMQPRVLLYDEPTSALDPNLKAEVGKTLRAVAERTGMTQIVVTHDPAWADAHCDDVFVLDGDGIRKAKDT
jgi:ABC-type polar amino acid transport system ATPase subunit